jgi:hypothetical protein
MTNENISPKRKWVKRIGLASIIGATLTGTFGGRDPENGGLFPVMVKKSGTSYGICLSGLVEMKDNSKHYGLIASLGTALSGEVNGVNISIIAGAPEGPMLSALSGRINGLTISAISAINSVQGAQLGLLNYADNVRVGQFGLVNSANYVNGIQAGVFYNGARMVKGGQIGAYNKISDNTGTNAYSNRGLIFNCDWGEKK